MPIIFPANCRGTTAGALQQLKQQGYTTASGGLFSKKLLDDITTNGGKTFFEPIEPAGIFMSKLDQVQDQIKDTTDAIQKASHTLVETARDANKSMTDVSGKMRDGADKLAFAIDKMMKVTGRGDFAHVVALTESLVDSLERLAELEQKGLLEKVMQAMQARA
jgi:soluble cytochrome b562